jgi:hypothetical protein
MPAGPAFWLFFVLAILSIVVGLIGLYYSRRAFIEAGDAKLAARQATMAAKTHLDTTELTQTSQKFEKLRPDIKFEAARSLLAEISRPVLRIAAYLDHEPSVKDTIANLKEALDGARDALQGVKPSDSNKELEAPWAVYNAIEGPFMEIDSLVSCLCGQLDAKTLPSAVGEENAIG